MCDANEKISRRINTRCRGAALDSGRRFSFWRIGRGRQATGSTSTTTRSRQQWDPGIHGRLSWSGVAPV